MKKSIYLLLFLFSIFVGCNDDNNTTEKPPEVVEKYLTIFFINDQHGQIDNFSKIKHIIDTERLKTNVIIACSGDIFSGNPVVDNYTEKGYPMIDMMNRVGFDVAVVGNHEYDYGEEILKDRFKQANFNWVCANVDMGSSDVPEPNDYKTINAGDVKATFLGLVETGGKDNDIIPSTHPWRVKNFTFEKPQDVVSRYEKIKSQENADLYIALTHIGHDHSNGLGDTQLANQFPYFDLIIGGHSHQEKDFVVNSIPIFQAGSNLRKLGKITLTIKDKNVESIDFDLINLENYNNRDEDLKAVIDSYNDLPYLKEVIGNSHRNHNYSAVGCFVTDAIRGKMNVDASFQNTGGIRSNIDQGDITKREIFEVLPFNNSVVKYSMTVEEIKAFLIGSGSGFYYSGIQIAQIGNDIEIKDSTGSILTNSTELNIGLNDYIPAIFDSYFPEDGDIQPINDAEAVISYLDEINSEVNYPSCNHYFKYSR